MNTYAQLKIAVPSFSGKLNHLEIHSVSEYVIFDDLLRSLVKYDSNGELAPDLAESWEIKNNFTEFIFKIRSNQYFSDHTVITSKDVASSLTSILKNPNIIHGDGSKIEKITTDLNTITIKLKKSSPFFLAELASPEYRIIKNNLNYQVTSGPYYISKENSGESSITLKKNEFFPFNSEVKFKEVNYIQYSKIEQLNLKNTDIIWPISTITSEEINTILKNNYYIYKLNMGFSYWFSLNPNTLNYSERLNIKNILDSILKDSSIFEKNRLSRANQLFLPLGPGRLKENEIHNINLSLTIKNNNPLKKLNFLLPRDINPELLKIIQNGFKNYTISYYSNFSEYSKIIKHSSFDLYLVNNDLSSIDLRSSIIVTFNKNRPLVFLEKNNIFYEEILNKIENQQNSLKRYSEIKNLGEKILKDVLIYPLYYDLGYVLVKQGIDLSALNQAGAETFSWKIK